MADPLANPEWKFRFIPSPFMVFYHSDSSRHRLHTIVGLILLFQSSPTQCTQVGTPHRKHFMRLTEDKATATLPLASYIPHAEHIGHFNLFVGSGAILTTVLPRTYHTVVLSCSAKCVRSTFYTFPQGIGCRNKEAHPARAPHYLVNKYSNTKFYFF